MTEEIKAELSVHCQRVLDNLWRDGKHLNFKLQEPSVATVHVDDATRLVVSDLLVVQEDMERLALGTADPRQANPTVVWVTMAEARAFLMKRTGVPQAIAEGLILRWLHLDRLRWKCAKAELERERARKAERDDHRSV